MLRSLFSDQIWWSAIWFVANEDKILGDDSGEDSEYRINPYNLLHTVRFEEFMELLVDAAGNVPPLQESQALPMGWIIMSSVGTAPVKYSRNSMTYFRFPYSICMSTTKLSSLGERDFDAICDVETRPDGVLIWAWLDRSTLKNRMYLELICYKVSNDGVLGKIGSIRQGYGWSPADNSAKAVQIAGDKWIVRDYYLKSSSGGIGYVQTTVDISSDMKAVMDAGNSIGYANVNEISGSEGQAKGTVHYSDGMLESDYAPYDLDNSFMDIPSWGNDGKQYGWVGGYSGYQIHNSSLL